MIVYVGNSLVLQFFLDVSLRLLDDIVHQGFQVLWTHEADTKNRWLIARGDKNVDKLYAGLK